MIGDAAAIDVQQLPSSQFLVNDVRRLLRCVDAKSPLSPSQPPLLLLAATLAAFNVISLLVSE